MNTITIYPKTNGGVCDLPQLGIRGENRVTQILFDFSAWAEELGPGVVSLLVKRPRDAAPYPVLLMISGNAAIWEISAVDTAVPGILSAEYLYTVDERTAKTYVFNLQVVPDIGCAAEPPDPYETWIDELVELGAQVQQDANNAEQSADAAAISAADAAGSANEAFSSSERADASALRSEGFAVGEQNGIEVLPGSPYYANNAKFYAEAAEQSAADGGWVHFYIDANGYLHYVKTPNIDLVFSIRNGFLHVTV